MEHQPRGYVSIVLHSHLPFVKHPEHERFLEENWLYEAMMETYIPFLMSLEKLESEGIYPRITVSMTPPLCHMLEDELLNHRFEEHLLRLLELLDKEVQRVAGDGEAEQVVYFYRERFQSILAYYRDTLQRSILGGYRRFMESGAIEIITCGATHGFLPNLRVTPRSVHAQIALGVASYKRIFGRQPRGIWLPECAYYEGLEDVLAEHGIEYFLTDTHGLLFSRPRALYGNYAPIVSPRGVAAFGRDQESSKQVWSSKEGYPGDIRYRDFYRDVGWDLEYEYIKPYINPDGKRVFVGLKYYRITGDSDHKELYDPAAAQAIVQEHASNFLFNREKQIEYLQAAMGKAPIVVCPYDAELFGHWWYEGIDFLYHFSRKMAQDQDSIAPITLGEYLDRFPEQQIARPAASTWGDKGYNEVWLNEGNDWIYKYLHDCSITLSELARKYATSATPEQERLLNQLGRELLLAESSDWAFLMTTRTAAEYSSKRTVEHIENFRRVRHMLEGSEPIDWDYIESIEFKDSIFYREMDFRLYCP
ncbi:glycoside hydrolase family 57 protein [Chrysiogenes arsenatis]|uniref:glycoside hydrolase family 57 protein n=1 Tax=Chrysiogenes arsenatis TaxID=309797 RepID=UPI000427478C|nr:1,4-alpha-glucan branching protein domain-containing protein [Chrysiogenes arsenatis]